MKRICFTIGSTDIKSGIVKVVLNLIRELRCDNNYKISVLSIKEITKKDIFFEYMPDNIELLTLNINDNARKTVIFSAIPELIKFFNKHNFDTIIISGMEFVIPFYVAGLITKTKTKFIAWEHVNFFAGPKFRLEWIGKRIAIKYFKNIVTITKKDFNQYINYKKNTPVYQIYNVGKYPARTNEYNSNTKKIISVGYLAHIKGFDMLMDIARKVFDIYPEWSWDIYGEGTERLNLETKIKELNLENNVHLKGYSSDINNKYSEYSMFVLTSRQEGMGMVMIEAQKAGLPVISFDIPCGPSDIIVDGINGYLVKPFDIEKMASKIAELIENTEKRKVFSDNSTVNHMELENEFILKKWKEIL